MTNFQKGWESKILSLILYCNGRVLTFDFLLFSAKWEATFLWEAGCWILWGSTSSRYGFHLYGIWNWNLIWLSQRLFEKLGNRKMQCSCRARRTKSMYAHLPGSLSMLFFSKMFLQVVMHVQILKRVRNSGTPQGKCYLFLPLDPIPCVFKDLIYANIYWVTTIHQILN